MTYVTKIAPCIPNKRWRWNESCHLYADTVDELHRCAAQLGLKRQWFRFHRLVPYYDLTSAKRRLAIEHGAKAVSNRDFNRRRKT